MYFFQAKNKERNLDGWLVIKLNIIFLVFWILIKEAMHIDMRWINNVDSLKRYSSVPKTI